MLRKIKSLIPGPVKEAIKNGMRAVKKQVRYFTKEKGGTYYCPCCNRRFRSMAECTAYQSPEVYNPERYTIKEKSICPYCGSLSRHRILASWLSQNFELIQGKKILYFAIEDGMKKWFRRLRIPVTSADFQRKDVDLKLNIQDMDLPDECYDIIICNHVLEHVEDYKKALSELKRVLSRKGMLLLSVPIDLSLKETYENKSITEPEKRLKEFGQFDHLRVFAAPSLEKILKQEFPGGGVEVIRGEEMPPAIVPVMGPADYDVNFLYLCRK